MDIVVKASALLESCKDIVLASVSENGFPRPCVLSKIKSEGIRRFWVATGLEGVKTHHFLQNSKAGACCFDHGDSITLTGAVTVRTDATIRQEMWLDWFIHHFPGGVDDPNYCILEFETNEATLWIDQEFVTVTGDAL